MAFTLFETPIAKHHRHIDIRAQHVVTALAGDQAHIDVRIGGMEAVQTWHQPVRGEGKVGRHLQHFMLLLCADCAQSCVDILQTELNLIKKYGPGLGQFDTSVDAVEQPRGELLLQPFDLLADRRLRRAKLHRRSGKAAMAGRRFKGPQQVQRQVTKGVIHKLC